MTMKNGSIIENGKRYYYVAEAARIAGVSKSDVELGSQGCDQLAVLSLTWSTACLVIFTRKPRLERA